MLKEIVSQYTDSITIRRIKRKYKNSLLSKILVNYLLGKEKIYSDDGIIIYEDIIKVKLNKDAKNLLELPKDEIIEKLKKEKYFLIDCSLYNLHSKKGKESLKVQISQSLAVIRRYLFDINLIIINKDMDLSFLGKNMIKVFKNVNEIDFSKYNPVILDPYAEKELKEDEIKDFNLFLLGGIVDVGLNWERATEYLFRDLNFERRKIVLGDTIIGVPDRINLIIKILLETYYDKIPLEKAIVKNQGKKDIINRIFYELKKGSSVDEMLKYINISKEKLEEFIKRYKTK